MTESHYGFRIFLLLVILGVNAFFAGAQAALNLLANPERLLSVTQIGVTLASLGLGWAGEGTLYSLFIGVFQPLMTPGLEKALHAAGFVVAFLIMSYFHVVIGEVVPKNLAIEHA